MRILIVDDNQDGRLILEKTLESAGHEVETAVHGEDALEKARLSMPDIIISDILMPVMDGFKLCYRAKNDAALKHIPFVFYTATYVDLDDERLALGLGASRYIIKPIDHCAFLRIINEVVDEARKETLLVPEHTIDDPLELFPKYDAALSRKLGEKVRELELFQKIFADCLDGVAVTDPAGRFRQVNPTFRAMFGYGEAELSEKTPAMILGEESFRKRMTELEKVPAVKGESQMAEAGGSPFHMEYAVTSLHNEWGDRIAMVWTFTDITDRCETESALRLFRRLVDLSNDAIFVVDAATSRFIDINERACSQLQYSRDELLALRVIDIDPNFSSMELWNDHVESLRHQPEMLIETLHHRKDGLVFPVEINIKLTREGNRELVIAVSRDISERKEAEERERKARREWERTFDAVQDIVTLQGKDMRFTRVNRAACEAFKADSADLVGRYCHEVFENAGDPCELCPVHESRKTFASHTAEIEHKGMGKTFQVTTVPISDDSGNIECIAHFARDITDQKKLEAQYLHAQKMEAVGRLSSGIAHDFNNLLTTIIGYSQLLLLRLPPDSPMREEIEAIHHAGDRAATLTRQLLTFSRKQLLDVKPLNPANRVHELGKMLQRMIGEDVELDIRADEADDFRIMADEAQFDQILMNLAVNARDAMPRGGRLILETRKVDLDETSARLHEGLTPGPHVLIEVTDTGEGMTRDVREKIFEPFFTTKERGKGTGLGMAAVYGIVRQHKGAIDVYSEPGKGTTFRIYFPASSEKPGTVSAAGLKTHLQGGAETILVVDDEDGVRGLIGNVLRPLGYNVLEAATGEDALRVCAEHQGEIHLLLVDMVMPGMNGLETARAAKARRSAMKVVHMSGYPRDISFALDNQGEGMEYLPKPIMPSHLANKIRKVLDSNKGA